MKKRLFLIVASAMLALSLGACKVNKADNSSSGNSSGNSSSSSSVISSSSSASDSGSPSSSSSEGPQFADTDYSVKINSEAAITFTTEGEEDLKDGEQQKIGTQYQHALTVAAGDVLTFFKLGTPITPYAGGEAPANNVACNLSTMELTVVKAATATCYFKAYENGTYDLWLTGNEGGTGGGNFTPASPVTWAFASSTNEWSTSATPLTQDTADMPDGVKDQYSLLDHSLAYEEEFKITNGSDWYGFATLETNANFEGADAVGEQNIKTLVAGEYDIFLKIYNDDHVSIYISQDDPLPVDTDYKLSVNGGVPLVFTTAGQEDIIQDEVKVGVQYQLLNVSVEANDILTFQKVSTPITVTAGSYVDNNASYNLSTLELRAVMTANEATCYLKVFNNDTYQVWLTGNTSGTGGGDFVPGTGEYLFLDFGNCAEHWNGKLAQVDYSDYDGTWAYFYNGSGTVGPKWPGSLMEHVIGNVYRIEILTGADHVIFNVMGWQGDCQTANLDIPTDGKNLFTITSSNTGGSNQTGTWSTYGE